MNNFDIKDSRLYDYLAEKNEQESTEEEYSAFFDEGWEMDLEADLHDRD